jgi:hypothetical protein
MSECNDISSNFHWPYFYKLDAVSYGPYLYLESNVIHIISYVTLGDHSSISSSV